MPWGNSKGAGFEEVGVAFSAALDEDIMVTEKDEWFVGERRFRKEL